MSEQSKRKATFQIDTDLLERFNETIRDIGLRRDSWLNRTLRQEFGFLEDLPENSVAAGQFLGYLRKVEQSKKKVVLNLDTDLVEQLDEVCARKRVSRDAFLEDYFTFLIDGDSRTSAVPPLWRVQELITCPRIDYPNGDIDGTAYDALHLPDEELEGLWKRLESRVKKNQLEAK